MFSSIIDDVQMADRQKRRLSQDPCAGVARPDTPERRDRVLNNAEIIALWRAADVERSEFGAPLKLLLLTGSRLNQVTGMHRAEISDDGATWTIPSSRTKNKRTHVVPLPPLARTLIERDPTTDDLVFTTDGAHPVVIG